MLGWSWWLANRGYRTPGISSAAPPPSPFDPYEDEETKRRARAASMSALFGGLLDSYLSGGQNIGRAFEAQREAGQGVRDRAVELNRIRVQDEHQRRQDELYEESRRSEIENRRIDNERAQRELEAKEMATREKAEREAAQLAAEREQNRKLVERVRAVNPTLADQLGELVESDRFPVGEAVGAMAPKEGDPYRANREERAARADERAAQAAERAAATAERQRLDEHRRAIADREDRIYDDLMAQRNPFEPVSEPVRAKLRRQARERAEAEIGRPAEDDVPAEVELEADPGYTPALRAAAAAKGFDVAKARRDGIPWAEIRRFLGLGG